MIDIISLGAGVQSSTMALMAKHGEITPMPNGAIFADTGNEPKSVYKWLEWLEKQLPFPVHRVSAGNLGESALRLKVSKKGNTYTKHAIPAFIVDQHGKGGLLMRQCTSDFKIIPIQRKIRELRGKEQVSQWIGISLDEVSRMKPSRKKYITNRWPLIELRMTREGCLQWMSKNGYPIPPRSACSFCPFHSDKEWLRLKNEEPEAFQEAVDFEVKYQETMKKVTGFRGTPFLHRSHLPISQINFGASTHGQRELFNNECEGMCGV